MDGHLHDHLPDDAVPLPGPHVRAEHAPCHRERALGGLALPVALDPHPPELVLEPCPGRHVARRPVGARAGPGELVPGWPAPRQAPAAPAVAFRHPGQRVEAEGLGERDRLSPGERRVGEGPVPGQQQAAGHGCQDGLPHRLLPRHPVARDRRAEDEPGLGVSHRDSPDEPRVPAPATLRPLYAPPLAGPRQVPPMAPRRRPERSQTKNRQIIRRVLPSPFREPAKGCVEELQTPGDQETVSGHHRSAICHIS